MRKYVIVRIIGTCLIVLLVACNGDDGNGADCPGQLGEMETIFGARWTVFEYFDNGALSVTGMAMDQFCLSRATMGFTAEPDLERQDFMFVQSFRESTNIRFWQTDEDAILGKWEIVEGEPNWVQFDEITGTSVKGRFQATLAVRETGNYFYTLPDTLLFDNVRFEAVPMELLNGSN